MQDGLLLSCPSYEGTKYSHECCLVPSGSQVATGGSDRCEKGRIFSLCSHSYHGNPSCSQLCCRSSSSSLISSWRRINLTLSKPSTGEAAVAVDFTDCNQDDARIRHTAGRSTNTRRRARMRRPFLTAATTNSRPESWPAIHIGWWRPGWGENCHSRPYYLEEIPRIDLHERKKKKKKSGNLDQALAGSDWVQQ
jgi:hypothetical protein